MIARKFREEMRFLKTGKWAIRFWFDWAAPRVPREMFIEEVKRLINASEAQLPETIADVIAHAATPEIKLAAVEVISGGTRNGVVDYFEWP